MKQPSLLNKVFCAALVCLISFTAMYGVEAYTILTSDWITGQVSAVQPSSLTLTISPPTITLGQNFTLVATLNTATSGQPISFYVNDTGTVTFIGNVMTDAIGTAINSNFKPDAIGAYSFLVNCTIP